MKININKICDWLKKESDIAKEEGNESDYSNLYEAADILSRCHGYEYLVDTYIHRWDGEVTTRNGDVFFVDDNCDLRIKTETEMYRYADSLDEKKLLDEAIENLIKAD